MLGGAAQPRCVMFAVPNRHHTMACGLYRSGAEKSARGISNAQTWQRLEAPDQGCQARLAVGLVRVNRRGFPPKAAAGIGESRTGSSGLGEWALRAGPWCLLRGLRRRSVQGTKRTWPPKAARRIRQCGRGSLAFYARIAAQMASSPKQTVCCASWHLMCSCSAPKAPRPARASERAVFEAQKRDADMDSVNSTMAAKRVRPQPNTANFVGKDPRIMGTGICLVPNTIAIGQEERPLMMMYNPWREPHHVSWSSATKLR